MKRNEWQARFGAKRRAVDRAILQECERRIADEIRWEPANTPHLLDPIGMATAIIEAEERERIARAFGRSL